MQYARIVPGVFITRPNRFIAHIQIDDTIQICHVKNTGRCRELLAPGARVWCQEWDSPTRKTKFDLIAVQKGERIINMDSQAPNAAVREWLAGGALGPLESLQAEYTHGDSRFDFSFLMDGRRHFLEVKGVTLENDGICAFPDAPTARGIKHLQGLTQAAREGFGAWVLFVIQMADVKYMTPNAATDPAFAQALRQAAAQGVHVIAMDCAVTPESMQLRLPIPVRL